MLARTLAVPVIAATLAVGVPAATAAPAPANVPASHTASPPAHYALFIRWNQRDPRVTWRTVTWNVWYGDRARRRSTRAFYRHDEWSIDPARRFGEYLSVCQVRITAAGDARLINHQEYGDGHC